MVLLNIPIFMSFFYAKSTKSPQSTPSFTPDSNWTTASVKQPHSSFLCFDPSGFHSNNEWQ